MISLHKNCDAMSLNSGCCHFNKSVRLEQILKVFMVKYGTQWDLCLKSHDVARKVLNRTPGFNSRPAGNKNPEMCHFNKNDQTLNVQCDPTKNNYKADVEMWCWMNLAWFAALCRILITSKCQIWFHARTKTCCLLNIWCHFHQVSDTPMTLLSISF